MGKRAAAIFSATFWRDLVRKGPEKAKQIILSPYRAFQSLCYWTGFGVIVSGLAFLVWLILFFSSIPDFDALDMKSVHRLAEARIHKRLENKRKKHKWVEIKDISRDFLYSVVMSEDGTFFEHEGINYDAIVNSLAYNLRKRSYEAGGSTISQQVVKNLFLTNEKSIIRKMKEILITSKMEDRFGKNQILEMYLNIAEFGPDIFGVSEAASHYFGKKPSQINAAEGAFIALMLPSPRRYHYSIFQNHYLPESKKRKIRRVLGDMLANEFISPRQYRSYINYNFFKRRGVANKR